MRILRQILRWISAIALVALILIMAISCIDIYLSAEEVESPLVQMYKPEDVQARFRSMALPCLILSGIPCVAGLILMFLPGAGNQRKPIPSAEMLLGVQVKASARQAKGETRGLQRQRIILLIIAAAFIFFGVMNGGWYDVLVKAINICTECIGLG